ncbi:MAG: hypothetical protein JO361_12100, partial [Gammaproteobacteria bacterium]|nr:hypothetical protein [Gammaproteobacteria bacterium]
EWPERAAGRLAPADLALDFSLGDGGHDIATRAHSRLGRTWLAQLEGEDRDPARGGGASREVS